MLPLPLTSQHLDPITLVPSLPLYTKDYPSMDPKHSSLHGQTLSLPTVTLHSAQHHPHQHHSSTLHHDPHRHQQQHQQHQQHQPHQQQQQHQQQQLQLQHQHRQQLQHQHQHQHQQQHQQERPDSPTSLEDSQSESGIDILSVDSAESTDEIDIAERIEAFSLSCLSAENGATTLPSSVVRNPVSIVTLAGVVQNGQDLAPRSHPHPAPALMMATPPLSPTRYQFVKEPLHERDPTAVTTVMAVTAAPTEPLDQLRLDARRPRSMNRARASMNRARAGSAPPTARVSRPTRAATFETQPVFTLPPKIPKPISPVPSQATSAWAALLPGVAPIRVNPRPTILPQGTTTTTRPPGPSIGPEPSLHHHVPIVLTPEREARLTMEMYSLFESLLPTEESHQRRTRLIRKIESIVHSEWLGQDIKVLPFGSTVNDLGTNTSDVDICILTSWLGLQGVEMLAEVFRKHGMDNVFCVPGAKVPIVKLWDPELQLSCDMNINTQLGIMNSRMVRTYVAIDDRVRPFAMIIKHWARKRVLNDAANGGTISTYSWICMVINFLQMRSPPILPSLHDMPHELSPDNQVINGNNTSFFSDLSRLEGFGRANKESLGGLLYAFFRKFAIEFDYDHHVVSVRHGCYLTKESKGWHIPGKHYRLLCVEEPFDTTRNLGNSCDMASSKGLKQEFRRALDILNHGGSLDQVCEQWVFPPCYYHNNCSNFRGNGYSSNNSNTTAGRRYTNGFRSHHHHNAPSEIDARPDGSSKCSEPSRHSRTSNVFYPSSHRRERSGNEKRSRSSSAYLRDTTQSFTTPKTNSVRKELQTGLEANRLDSLVEEAIAVSIPSFKDSKVLATSADDSAVHGSAFPNGGLKTTAQLQDGISGSTSTTEELGNKMGSSRNMPLSRQKLSSKAHYGGDGSKTQGGQKNGRVGGANRDGARGAKAPRTAVELCLADIAKIVNKSELVPSVAAEPVTRGGESIRKKGSKKSVLWSTNSNRGESRGNHHSA